MRKIAYVMLALLVASIALADDRIIQFILGDGTHVSFRTSDIQRIGYLYHNQDSIDQAYADSLARDQFVRDSLAREEFLRDSLLRDSLWKDGLRLDSIGRSTTLDHMLDSTDRYTIFRQALRRTALMDSLAIWQRDTLQFVQLWRENYSGSLLGASVSQRGFTVFAESDEVLAQNGIHSLDDLTAYANQAYGDAAEWYDYLSASGLSVSTGTDYTSRLNALNMFVAYHIVHGAMPANGLLYEKGQDAYWNVKPGSGLYDYYETLLPHTLVKLWEPDDQEQRTIYLNRYQTNNTLTDEVGTQGSAAMHTLVSPGTELLRQEGSVSASNGYVHPIGGMLVYDRQVPRGVLNERMRFSVASLLPEMSTYGMRSWSTGDGQIPSGYDTSRLGIPNGFFRNLTNLSDRICMVLCLHGAWRCYQSSQLQWWGSTWDVVIKLPPVPAGVYELRIPYAPMYNGSKVFLSWGKNPHHVTQTDQGPELPDFVAIDTLDLSIPYDDPRIGLTDAWNEEDLGMASDKALRERGYMRGPHSYCGHGELGYEESRSCRFEYGYGAASLRRIVARIEMDGCENWLRIKALPGNNIIYGLDFIELVPVAVCDNGQYTEDWY